MAAYPTFTGGFVVQRPWGYSQRFMNVHNDMPHGWRYSYNLRATALLAFQLVYPALSDADLVTLIAFYEARKGGFENFDMVHPETLATHTKCRFAGSALEIRQIGPNENAVNVLIEEHA